MTHGTIAPDLAAATAKVLRVLAGQARSARPALRTSPALADCVGDWADELQGVGDALARDVMPVGGLRRLARAHGLLMVELLSHVERPR
jgi:hypothetical protein